MVSFSISYQDLIKIPYSADTTEKGDRGERRPKDGVTLRISLLFCWLWSSKNFSKAPAHTLITF